MYVPVLGGIEHISSSSYRITNTYFNTHIKFILVNNIGRFKSSLYTLNIVLKDSNVFNVVDRLKDDGIYQKYL